MNPERRGIWYGIGAYASWGVFPLYWKLLASVPVVEVVSHRIVWSAALLLAWVAARGQWRSLAASLATPGVLATYATASALIAVNWGIFLWAVGAGHVVETSLGYFINPLLSLLLAVFVLGERLRRWQWVAVALAAAGVLWLAFAHGELPWISLVLATTFALYGLVKKRAPLGSVHGLTIETGLLALPSAALLAWTHLVGEAAFLGGSGVVDVLLVSAGAVTVAPLLMFATAAQRIPLLWVGLLQYIAPTLQLAIGVLVFGEPFTQDRVLGFSLVWLALVVFAVEGLAAHRATAVVPLPE